MRRRRTPAGASPRRRRRQSLGRRTLCGRPCCRQRARSCRCRQTASAKRRIAIKSNWPVKFSCHDAQFGSPHKNINKCVHAKKSLKELSRHKIFIVTALIYIPVPAPPQRSFVHLLPPPGPRNISPARPSPRRTRGSPPRPPSPPGRRRARAGRAGAGSRCQGRSRTPPRWRGRRRRRRRGRRAPDRLKGVG